MHHSWQNLSGADYIPCATEKYRGLQQRLVANAESVAFYSGIGKEGGLIRDAFRSLARHLQGVLTANWTHSMWEQFHLKCAPLKSCCKTVNAELRYRALQLLDLLPARHLQGMLTVNWTHSMWEQARPRCAL